MKKAPPPPRVFLTEVLGSAPIEAHDARAQIQQRLKEAIISGALPDGTPLRQAALAQLFGVSRMPVREALRQLEAKGFIVSTRFKGAVVASAQASDDGITDLMLEAAMTEAFSLGVLQRDTDEGQAESLRLILLAAQRASRPSLGAVV